VKNEKGLLRRDFRAFLFVIWKRLGLPPPTAIQYDIAQYLQHGPRRKMIMAFRGVGKTSIYAAYALWRLTVEPETKILVVSASKSLADSIAGFIKQLIDDTPLFYELKARRDQRDGSALFDVGPASPSKDPSLKAVGICGQITGSRADEILADDVESAGNALTEAARRKLAEQVKEFDAVLKPAGSVTYLGTPQSCRSMYLSLPERGYETRIWPAEIPQDPSVYGDSLAPYVHDQITAGGQPGDPLDRVRFDRADLNERRASFGPSGYALQFLLDARETDAARFPLKLSDLIVAQLDPQTAPNQISWSNAPETRRNDLPLLGLSDDFWRGWTMISQDQAAYSGGIMAIDPAGRGADETAFSVVKQLNGMLFLTHSGGLGGGYDETTLQAIAAIARDARANRIVIEANFGDGMFLRLLQPVLTRSGVNASLEETRCHTAKEQRMLAVLEPVLAQHRLVVDEDVIVRDAADAERNPEQSLFFQMTRLGPFRGCLRHDDRLDALAMAVAAWAPALARDTDKAAAAQRAKALKAEVKAITRNKPHKLTRRPPKPKWVGR
jgi:hypothetical protein